MGEAENIQPKGEKIKKALLWTTEILTSHPQMPRREIIEKAQIRFNLSPKECEFLNKNFLEG
jgi:hypothetical protein